MNPLLQEKIDLIDFAFRRFDLHSFADLGGVWGVEGGYTFQTLEKYSVSSATLVDTHPTVHVKDRSSRFPQLRILQGNFGSEAIASQVGSVDAIFLFDVLLHQVTPDWDRVLAMYANQTRCFIVYNQQWTGSEHTVRLLDLGEENYFRNVPHVQAEQPYNDLFLKLDQKHPDHDRTWRDVHHIWQWGITDTDLISKVSGLGFRLQVMMNCGPFGNLPNFENHVFVFLR